MIKAVLAGAALLIASGAGVLFVAGDGEDTVSAGQAGRAAAPAPVAPAPEIAPAPVAERTKRRPRPAPRASAPRPQPRRAAPARTRAALPSPRIEIARIGVRAHVIDSFTNDRGKLIPPRSFDVAGWWSGGTAVGGRGPAVVVGHVDDRVRPGVFSRLHELRPGDRIRYVGDNGEVHRFEVVRSEQHRKARFPTQEVYGPTRARTLRLVTCTGPFLPSIGHYRDNLIVFARHV